MSRKKVSAKITVSDMTKCSVFVLGMDLHCPLCGVLVKSGERHECTRADRAETPRQKGAR